MKWKLFSSLIIYLWIITIILFLLSKIFFDGDVFFLIFVILNAIFTFVYWIGVYQLNKVINAFFIMDLVVEDLQVKESVLFNILPTLDEDVTLSNEELKKMILSKVER